MDLARVRWEQAKAELGRLTNLGGSAQPSVKELTDARAAEKSRKLELDLAKLRHDSAVCDHQLHQALLNQLTLRAPFDGYVVAKLKAEGEVANEREGVLTLARLDPLDVWINVPLTWALKVRAGDQAEVMPTKGLCSQRVGKVVFVSRVADASSQTYRIKLVVTNADGAWPGGMSVSVGFPQRTARSKTSEPRTSVRAGLPR